MNDITDEQVMGLIKAKFPQHVDEAFNQFRQFQNELGLNNYETVLFFLKSIGAEGAEGNFKNLLGRMKG